MNKLKEAFDRFEHFQLSHLFEAESGERRRIQIERHDDWELILMIWGPDSQTEIHDHDEGQCWTRILSGELLELTYQGIIPKLTNSQILKIGETGYIDDKIGTHQLINNQESNVISLHLYADPISRSSYFDHPSGMWISRDITSELMQGINFYEKSISP